MSKGYQVIEPILLKGLFALPKNHVLAVAALSWLVERLHKELKEQLGGAQIEVIRVEYVGAYPALGIHYETANDRDLGPLVEATITRLLEESSVLDFIAFAERSTIDWKEATDELMQAPASATLRSLERNPSPSHGTSGLELWYARVRDVPFNRLTVDDLGRALRQELALEHVVPLALRRAELDPNQGSQYDGELVSALARIPRSFWDAHRPLLVRARPILAAAVRSVDDDQLGQELRAFDAMAGELTKEEPTVELRGKDHEP